jgi:hypothetical protein
MIQHLDVLCGDATVDLSEELLLGDTGLLQSINMRKKVPHGHEAQGVDSLESSNPDILQPSFEAQGVTTSEPSTSEGLQNSGEIQGDTTSEPSTSEGLHSLGEVRGATTSEHLTSEGLHTPGEVQGVTTSEPSTSECFQTSGKVQELITSQTSDEYHSSTSSGTKVGAAASSPLAESEPPKGRTVKVPERVSIHSLSLLYFLGVFILILGFLLVDILCILFVPLSDNT